MSERFWTFAARRWVNWLAAGVMISAVALAWLGFQAVSEWRHQSTLLAQRNADAAVDLLVTAITRDMRAVQTAVLPSLRLDTLGQTTALDLNAIGSAFARYPYPDAFFAGRVGPEPAALIFYTRADRAPSWLAPATADAIFPVMRGPEPATSARLMARLRRDAEEGKRVAAFDLRVRNRDYQAVALLSYTDAARETLDAVVGFVVDLDWAADRYFADITTQVARISGSDGGIRLAVTDAAGRRVAGSDAAEPGAPFSTRPFSLLFFDPTVVEVDPPPDLRRNRWHARATVSGDRALIAARLGAGRTLLLVAGSALALAGGLALMVRAEQATARLIDLRSNFVSAVTHELKTPIATIRAISETLAAGRSSHPEMTKEYAQMAVHEAKRLTRLVDNLLAYSRMSDVADAYLFEVVSLEALVRQSLKEFSSQLADAGFVATLDIPENLPQVRADRTAMVLAIDNLIDNAIRYSGTARQLTLAAHAAPPLVVLEVRDLGRGIAPGDLPLVTRRFFRGHGEAPGGSGLGLSIVERIVADHGGVLSIRSELGAGTSVSVGLPAARVEDEEAHSDR